MKGLRMSVEEYNARQEKQAPRHKYSAIPTDVDGIRFPSKKEANRYRELSIMRKAGEITDLKLQVSYDIAINGMLICRYVADFVYRDKTGVVTEDVKGVKTPVYRIKKKLMKAIYGIDIKET